MIALLPARASDDGRRAAPCLPPRIPFFLFSGLWFLALCLSGTTAAAQTSGEALTRLSLDGLDAFRPAASNWTLAGGVRSDRAVRWSLESEPGTGILVNLPSEGARENLFTTWEHGDLELELDVLLPKGSNSGLYLQGRYEVQLFDSWGVERPTYADLGGIYERWDEERPDGEQGYEGQPPRVNASRAPGLWQRLHVEFQAPRFDADGIKIADARFVRVSLNGVVIHENVAVTGPTRAAAFDDERPTGPLMLQGDHGPVAFRHIRYKRYIAERVRVGEVRYRWYEGAFSAWPDLARPPDEEGRRNGLTADVGTNPDTFAVAFEGTLDVPSSGIYRFDLGLGWITGDPHFQGKPIGGGMLRVEGRPVVRHDGTAREATGTITLSAGEHPFTLAYFKNRSGQEPSVDLFVEGPDTPRHALHETSTRPAPVPVGAIYVEPYREPVVQRSFVVYDGAKRTHAVSVGDPGGVHYALDLQQGALLYVWRGPFLDTTPMWHSRGQDQVALPRGSVLSLSGAPGLAVRSDPDAPWPARVDEDAYRFLGYDLDAAGRPTFHYEMYGVAVDDRLVPAEANGGLVRTLTLQAAGTPPALWVRAAAGSTLERLPDGAYAVEDRTYYVELDAPGAAIRTTADGQELLVPVRFDDGSATVSYAIVW